MRYAVKRILALAALTLIVPAVGAGVADAVGGVTPRPGGAISMRGRLSSEIILECPVTLTGSFSNRFVGISGEGTQIATVNAVTSECASSEVAYRILAVLNLPWSVRLRKLDGTNPRFAPATGLSEATVQVAGVSFQLVPFHPEFGLPTCLFGGTTEVLELTPPLRFVRGFEYNLLSDSGSFSFRPTTAGFCREVFPTLEGSYSFEPPSPVQALTFTVGGEVREGLTPNPLDFGVLAPEGLAQGSVTIASTRGGRIETIVVATGRFFTVTDPNGCRGTVLAEGGRCAVNVIALAPAEVGRAVTDTITVTVGGRRFASTLRVSS